MAAQRAREEQIVKDLEAALNATKEAAERTRLEQEAEQKLAKERYEKEIEIKKLETERLKRQIAANADINNLLTEDFDYPKADGVYLTMEIVIALVCIGICLFCCGISLSFCVVYRYKKQKKEIMENMAQMRHNERIQLGEFGEGD